MHKEEGNAFERAKEAVRSKETAIHGGVQENREHASKPDFREPLSDPLGRKAWAEARRRQLAGRGVREDSGVKTDSREVMVAVGPAARPGWGG